MLHECQVAFGIARGDEIQQLVENATGRACPCTVGQPCPILPADQQRSPLIQRVTSKAAPIAARLSLAAGVASGACVALHHIAEMYPAVFGLLTGVA